MDPEPKPAPDGPRPAGGDVPAGPPESGEPSDLLALRSLATLYFGALRNFIELGRIWSMTPTLPHLPDDPIWDELVNELRRMEVAARDIDSEWGKNPEVIIRHVIALRWAQAVVEDVTGRIPRDNGGFSKDADGRIRPPGGIPDRGEFLRPGELDALRAALWLAESADESQWVIASQSDVTRVIGYRSPKRAALMERLRKRGVLLYQELGRPVGRRRYYVHMTDPGKHARLVQETKRPQEKRRKSPDGGAAGGTDKIKKSR